ncbi:hypothetical protein Btru_047904 [Bulinus truncatus]|nr:hypothetical protein Btru_047904 [Bulinus truncatus]
MWARHSTRSSRSSIPLLSPPCFENGHHLTLVVGASHLLLSRGASYPLLSRGASYPLLSRDGRVQVMTDTSTSVLTIQPVEPSDAGTMSVCLTSSLGSDQLVTTICFEDVPGPPEGKPHVYEISKHSASLSWSPPCSDGGSPVTYYTIEAKVRQQTTWDVLVPNCKDLNYHISDLKPCMSYQFRVLACNKHGLGPPSEPSDRTITTDPLRSFSDEESEGYPEVFTPTIEYRRADELPFEPRDVTLNTHDKFEDLYELGLEVGKGKFGVVYKCKQREDGKIFAAKILKSREKQMIKHEIDIMNSLRHPKLLLLWDAFEEAKRIILVMEYVGAGELFERVIDDDFVLTERDCVHFLRQICEGVAYMHGLNILHLDLKPENILCVAENSNRIKIIDFGLARKYNPEETVKFMFGTPEFIAPEVINFDAISYHTDMWSIGVICYVLLSGLSPFLGDDDNETLSNVTSGDFDFDDEAFEQISDEAKDFITKLLVKNKDKRMLTCDCLAHYWLSQDEVDGLRYKRLNTDRLKKFMVRRKWLKTGKAVLAVGRLRKSTSLSNLSRSSSNDSLLSSPSLATAVTETGSSANSFDDDIGSSSSRSTLTLGISADHEDESSSARSRVSAEDRRGNDGADRDLIKKQLTGLIEFQRAVNLRTLNGTKINKITPDDSILRSSAAPPIKDGSDIINKQRRTYEVKSDASPSSHSAPKFVKTMKRCKTCTGDAARFDVVVQACPEPVVTWYFENDEIKPDDRHILCSDKSTGAHSLVIRSIQEEDEGDYSCKAGNSLGEVTCTEELSVLVI